VDESTDWGGFGRPSLCEQKGQQRSPEHDGPGPDHEDEVVNALQHAATISAAALTETYAFDLSSFGLAGERAPPPSLPDTNPPFPRAHLESRRVFLWAALKPGRERRAGEAGLRPVTTKASATWHYGGARRAKEGIAA
jgi:hypothetical protein